MEAILTTTTATTTLFYYPYGVTVNRPSAVYVANYQNNCVCKITAGTGADSTGGYAKETGSQTELYLPTSLAVDASGVLYMAN